MFEPPTCMMQSCRVAAGSSWASSHPAPFWYRQFNSERLACCACRVAEWVLDEYEQLGELQAPKARAKPGPIKPHK